MKTTFKKIETTEKKIDGETVRIQAKNFSITGFKALDEEGTFEAHASVFGNVDSYGEVVDRGAFSKWLEQYFNNNVKRFPKCVWSHNWDEPIAQTLECYEDAKGLYVKGKFVMEVQRAREVYALMKAGVITDFSFGFRVLDYETDEKTGIRHLTEIAIYEWSPVLVGANRDATLDGVKTDGEETTPADPAPEAPAADPVEDPAPEGDDPNAAGADPAPEATPAPAADDAGATEDGPSDAAPSDTDPAPADDPGKSGVAPLTKSQAVAAVVAATEAIEKATNALEALKQAIEDEDTGISSDTSTVEKREGKGGDVIRIAKSILRDARKADKMTESVILRAKAIIRES